MGSSERQARVFISSSFRDFGEERNLLVKSTFPRLKRFCADRDVTLIEVDLRWGITATQAENGKVVPICLAEIDNCRPYFVCMLGERYGWVLDEFSSELLSLYPWLDTFKGRSVTELEIRNAVLNHVKPDPNNVTVQNSLFYFRDDSFLEKVPSHLKGDYNSENEVSKTKLQQLKELITEELPGHVKRYSTPQDVAEMIYQDLLALFERDFSPIPRDSFSKEWGKHEAELLNLSKFYVPNQETEEQIKKYLFETSSKQPLIVVGEGGSGKSALLAHVCNLIKAKDPENFVIFHFVGVTDESTDPEKVLVKIMTALKNHFKFKRMLPAHEIEELINDFPAWLEYAVSNSKTKITLVIDGLDQMEKNRGSGISSIHWLPREFPESLKVILSCNAQTNVIQKLSERNWNNVVTIRPLSGLEKRQILEKTLSVYRKSLSEEQTLLFVNSPHTDNPLFLKVTIEELRVFGRFEALTERIQSYMSAENMKDLFLKVINRMEEDYEESFGQSKGTVEKVLTLLYATKTGFTESEILEILDISYTIWSPIYTTIQSELIRKKEGRLVIYSKYLREAISNKYFTLSEKESAVRELVIRSLEEFKTGGGPNIDGRLQSSSGSEKKVSFRQLEEVPYQLIILKRWDQLHQFVSDLKTLEHFILNSMQDELNDCWRYLESNKYDLVQTYKHKINEAGEDNVNLRVCRGLSMLFRYFGKYDASQEMVTKSLQKAEPNSVEAAEGYTNMAWLYYKARNYDKAEECHLQSLKIYQQIDTPAARIEQITVLNSLGVLYKAKNDLEKSKETHLKALELKMQETGDNNASISWSLLNLGVVQRMLYQYDEAEKNMLKSIELFKTDVGSVHLQMALRYNALARLYVNMKQFSKAEDMFKKDLEMREKILGPNHADIGYPLSGLAELYSKMKKYDLGVEMYQKTINNQVNSLGENHIIVGESWLELGEVYDEGLKDIEKAKECYIKANKIFSNTQARSNPKNFAILREKLSKYGIK